MAGQKQPSQKVFHPPYSNSQNLIHLPNSHAISGPEAFTTEFERPKVRQKPYLQVRKLLGTSALLVVTMLAIRNKCLTTSNKGI